MKKFIIILSIVLFSLHFILADGSKSVLKVTIKYKDTTYLRYYHLSPSGGTSIFRVYEGE